MTPEITVAILVAWTIGIFIYRYALRDKYGYSQRDKFWDTLGLWFLVSICYIFIVSSLPVGGFKYTKLQPEHVYKNTEEGQVRVFFNETDVIYTSDVYLEVQGICDTTTFTLRRDLNGFGYTLHETIEL